MIKHSDGLPEKQIRLSKLVPELLNKKIKNRKIYETQKRYEHQKSKSKTNRQTERQTDRHARTKLLGRKIGTKTNSMTTMYNIREKVLSMSDDCKNCFNLLLKCLSEKISFRDGVVGSTFC